MNDQAQRLHCLTLAMEIYRAMRVPHLVVENLAHDLYRFVKTGECQATDVGATK